MYVCEGLCKYICVASETRKRCVVPRRWNYWWLWVFPPPPHTTLVLNIKFWSTEGAESALNFWIISRASLSTCLLYLNEFNWHCLCAHLCVHTLGHECMIFVCVYVFEGMNVYLYVSFQAYMCLCGRQRIISSISPHLPNWLISLLLLLLTTSYIWLADPYPPPFSQ